MGERIFLRVSEWQGLLQVSEFFKTAESWKQGGRGPNAASRATSDEEDARNGLKGLSPEELPIALSEESESRKTQMAIARGVLRWLVPLPRNTASNCFAEGVETWDELIWSFELIEALLIPETVKARFWSRHLSHVQLPSGTSLEAAPYSTIAQVAFQCSIQVSTNPDFAIRRFGNAERTCTACKRRITWDSEFDLDDETRAALVFSRMWELPKSFMVRESLEILTGPWSHRLWSLESATVMLSAVRSKPTRPSKRWSELDEGVKSFLESLDEKLAVPWKGVVLAGRFPSSTLIPFKGVDWGDLEFHLLGEGSQRALRILLEATPDSEWDALAPNLRPLTTTSKSRFPDVLTRRRRSDRLVVRVHPPRCDSLLGLFGGFEPDSFCVAMTSYGRFLIHGRAIRAFALGREFCSCEKSLKSVCDEEDPNAVCLAIGSMTRGISRWHRCSLKNAIAWWQKYPVIEPPRTAILSPELRREEVSAAMNGWWESIASNGAHLALGKPEEDQTRRIWVNVDKLGSVEAIQSLTKSLVYSERFNPQEVAFFADDVPVFHLCTEPPDPRFPELSFATYLAILPYRTAEQVQNPVSSKRSASEVYESAVGISVRVEGNRETAWPPMAAISLVFTAFWETVRDKRRAYENDPSTERSWNSRNSDYPELGRVVEGRAMQFKVLKLYSARELRPRSPTDPPSPETK